MKKTSFFAVLLPIALFTSACTQKTELSASPETPTQVAITPTTTLPTQTSRPTALPSPQVTDSATPQNVIEEIQACPGAPAILLKVNDWARVSVNPPLSIRLRSQPSSSGEITGEVGPGKNVLVQEGPQCANGYTWWKVHTLDGQEGWTPEGDNTGYWLGEPISAWNQLPPPLQPIGEQTYHLREIQFSPDNALIHGIDESYYPLATPFPTPETWETPYPDDPRGGEFGFAAHAEHSTYNVSGVIEGSIQVYDLQDPLSRYYINNLSHYDCTQALSDLLARSEIEKSLRNPFCGLNLGIPFEISDVRIIEFAGGKGVRFLINSGNNIVYGSPYYFFQGISHDGRYYIVANLGGFSQPYSVNYNQLEYQSFGPLLAWGENESKALDSYQVFNARLIELMDAGEVMFYPPLALIDEMFSSIEIK